MAKYPHLRAYVEFIEGGYLKLEKETQELRKDTNPITGLYQTGYTENRGFHLTGVLAVEANYPDQSREGSDTRRISDPLNQ